MKKLHLLILAAIAGSTSIAHAQEATSGFRFSGFGTLAAVKTDTDEARFGSSPNGQLGGAHESGIDGSVDTKFGVQGSYLFNEKFSTTVQLLSQKGAYNDYVPRVEWAYVKYEPSNALSFRAGRIRLPAFLISDSKDIGYSQTWVRPPREVYSQFVLSYLYGADMIYRTKVGSFDLTLQPFVGTDHNYKIPTATGPLGLDVRNVYALSATAESGPWTFRIGSVSSSISLAHDKGDNAATDALNLFNTMVPGLGYGDLANKIRLHNSSVTFSGVSGIYDDGKWLAQSEYTIRRSDSLAVNDSTGWYVMGAYRIAKWTPYVTYASVKNNNPGSYVDHNNLPVISATVSAIMSGVYQSSYTDQHTWALGTRYDLMKNVALKGQFDHVTTGGANGNVRGLFVETTPAFRAGPHNVNVVSLLVDFVF